MREHLRNIGIVVAFIVSFGVCDLYIVWLMFRVTKVVSYR